MAKYRNKGVSSSGSSRNSVLFVTGSPCVALAGLKLSDFSTPRS